MASAEKREGFSLEPPADRLDVPEEENMDARYLQSVSLGNVAASIPQVQLPRKYRVPKPGEKSSAEAWRAP